MKMNFKSRKCEENGKKVLRYSIRKHHLGVASVAVASVLFFATGVATVQADGPAATTGATGGAGTTGGAGATGATGGAGTTGPTGGPAATGPTGGAGTTGPTGGAGATGPTGGAGATGTPGAAGSAGAAGAAGAAGSAGAAGAAGSTAEPANYDGKVSLIGQWTNESHEKKDTENTYKNATDKLGGPLSNPGLFRGAAKTFLGWSDKPPVDGKIAEGARLFSPEDTVSTAFPNGLSADSKLYGVYASLNKQDEPFPTDKFSMGFAIIGGMKNFAINNNKVKIDTNVKSEDVLPNTKLHKEEIDGNVRKIIDKVNPENNDTTKVNEVVLKAEFEMDNTAAMTVYRNPHVGYVGPVLSNTYKGNKFEVDERRKTYTYVDLNVNLDKDLVVPEKLYAEFNGYSWRPLYAIGIKEDGTKEILNVYSKNGTNLGKTKDSFNSLVSNTDPRVTFGVETKGYNNITFRMILRSSNGYDSDRPESERNERIAESVIKPDEGKSIAETIMRNMTLKTLSSKELKTLFPDKSDEEINQMVVRIAQDKAKDLAAKKEFLNVTGSVEGNVHPSAGRIGSGWLSLDSATNLPIHKVDANILELGYVLPPQPAPQPGPQPAPQPEPQPNPQPAPQPEPQPNPQPTPQPEPQPTPTPTPIPSENWNQGSIGVNKQDELPQTGSKQDEWLVALGGLSLLGALTVFPKKREE